MIRLVVVLAAIFWGGDALAAADKELMPVLFGLSCVLLAAKVGGFLAEQVNQPRVLGELAAGIAVGNLSLIGFESLDFIKTEPTFAVLSGLGALLMLFEVGLESDLKVMMKVGREALLVAVVGVALPSILGFLVSYFLAPSRPREAHLFVGAVLAATSIGISARVLKDIGKVQSREGRIILGAAVIDDVLGLIMLAIVSGIVTASGVGQTLQVFDVLLISSKALGFLIGALVIGVKIAPYFFRVGAKLGGDGGLLLISLILCFSLSYLAGLSGLAPIIGAFAAGLIIDGTGFEKLFRQRTDARHVHLEELLQPLSRFSAPVFFVMIGMQVELHYLFDHSIIVLGLCLTLAAIVGKILSGAVLSRKANVNRLAIGIGMMPRGEVGLIFAAIGSQLVLFGAPVISPSLYAAVIFMVMVTTMLTPPALVWAFSRSRK